jgi:hypothetical protein
VIEVVEAVEAPRGGSVSSHVATHLDSSSFDERAAQLGEKVDLADDNLEAHIHQVFDHQVGNLATSTGVVREQAPAHLTEAVYDMLDSPQDLRQAIILAEILSPRHELL